MFINENEYGSRILTQADYDAVGEVVASGKYFRLSVQRGYCVRTEELIAERLGDTNALLVCNGTVGLRVALKCIGVKPGDLVALNAFTFVATASAVLSLGAIPLAVDFDPHTNLALPSLTEALDRHPVAVVGVHWPGRCFDLSEVANLCREAGVPLVEDACQAFGAKWEGQYAGTFGQVGVFSFQQNKLVTCGEGGAIVTSDPGLYKRMSRYIDHGTERDEFMRPLPSGKIKEPGENYRLTEVQAAILYPQIERLDLLTGSLTKLKSDLLARLADAGVSEWTALPPNDLGQVATFLFADEEAADAAAHQLEQEGILLKPLWRRAFYDCYESAVTVGPVSRCPIAENLGKRLRLLPLPPTLSSEEIEKLSHAMTALKPYLTQSL